MRRTVTVLAVGLLAIATSIHFAQAPATVRGPSRVQAPIIVADQPEYSLAGVALAVSSADRWYMWARAQEAARAEAAHLLERSRNATSAVEIPQRMSHYVTGSSVSSVDWDAIATCETAHDARNPNPGQPFWSMQGPTYSGGLGFYNGTWSSFGGGEFAPNAGQASREQQIVVAERVYARYGLSGWGCRRYG